MHLNSHLCFEYRNKVIISGISMIEKKSLYTVVDVYSLSLALS